MGSTLLKSVRAKMLKEIFRVKDKEKKRKQ